MKYFKNRRKIESNIKSTKNENREEKAKVLKREKLQETIYFRVLFSCITVIMVLVGLALFGGYSK